MYVSKSMYLFMAQFSIKPLVIVSEILVTDDVIFLYFRIDRIW